MHFFHFIHIIVNLHHRFVAFREWYEKRGDKQSVGGQRSEEIEAARQEVGLALGNAVQRAHLAALLVEDGQLEAGIREYQAAIRLMPDDPKAARWQRQLNEALLKQEVLVRELWGFPTA